MTQHMAILMMAAAVGLVAATAASAADETPAPAAKKVNVLLITGGHPFDQAAFMKIFDAADLAVTAADQKLGSGVFDSIDDWKYDAILLYNFSQKIDEKQQANFRKLLDKGVGLFVLHHASAAYPDWPEYEAIMGGRFLLKADESGGVKRPASGTGGGKFRIHIEDPDHPITKGLSDFEIQDETYNRCPTSPKVHVLLTTEEKSSDKALAWCHLYGKARVLYLQSGHDNQVYANPSFRTLVAQGLRWTAGRLPEGDLKPMGAPKAAAAAPATESRSAAAEEKPKDEAKPLFNGKDFTGWKASDEQKKHWLIEDGVIKHDGKGGDLWTEAKYTDFVLKVDWRMPKSGDSGIYVRGSSKCQANIWCDPMGSGEVYGYRTDGKQPEEVRKACTPKKKADKPVGEWNAFVITMKGDRLTVVLNGEEVISNAQLPDCPKDGPIALQGHGDPMEFRNITIQELK